MTYRSGFISIGRGCVAYAVALAAAATLFILLLSARVYATTGNFSFLLQNGRGIGLALTVAEAVSGAILGAVIFLGLPMLPIYVVAMLFAAHQKIRHWSYFLGTGVLCSICAGSVFKLGLPASSHALKGAGSAWLLVILAGLFGGAACWYFLEITSRSNT